MKVNFSYKKFKLIFTTAFAVMIFSNLPVFADSPQIILFYTSWHAKTKQAKSIGNNLADKFNLKFVELDIDKVQAQQKIKNYGFKIPSAVPYIYVLNHKGKVIYGKVYKKGASTEIESKLQNYFK